MAVAERLRAVVREGDTVARLGGDEFAILLESLHHHDEADTTAARVLDALRESIVVPHVAADEVYDGAVFVAASVGIAVAEPGDEPDALIRNADVAMYAAKSRGKAQHARYEPAMHDRALARLRLEADLRTAVSELLDSQAAASPFHLVFQPIVDLRDGRMLGAEALLRWRHPERGLVPPVEFIPAAEDTGTIIPLGRWALEEACREAARWDADDDRAPYVCVNLSARQLQENALVDDVRSALAAAGLDPARLTLEITESVVMRDTALVLDRLLALKALGVRLAVDDFGTGYSSLAYLQQFPVDILKIDKSFVDEVARSADAAALARTIVALAEMLGLRTVAEGVEDAGQREALEAIGCAYGQGYLFARPLDAPSLRACLADVAVEA
jgi:predicted signal transduction protein with EAL and GGDEF domain